MFPMLVRDVLLTLAAHEFFTPKWSPAIRDEWTRNLTLRLTAKDPAKDWTAQVKRIADAVAAAFPDAELDVILPSAPALDPVDPKDRHVVMTAMAARADAIITYNVQDFAVEHLHRVLHVDVLHPDDFIMDLTTLNEKRAVAAFRELRARKKKPPWDVGDLVRRLTEAGLVQTALWVRSSDVSTLI
jgi:predicted nucleic acid-binding protein